jgi:hypothetical protein
MEQQFSSYSEPNGINHGFCQLAVPRASVERGRWKPPTQHQKVLSGWSTRVFSILCTASSAVKRNHLTNEPGLKRLLEQEHSTLEQRPPTLRIKPDRQRPVNDTSSGLSVASIPASF